MKIRQQLVTGESRKVTRGVNPCTTITVHQTGNTSKGANAAAHANLMSRGNSRSASWHATVDDREAVESYTADAKCWHAGKAKGNDTSYAVELCVNTDGDYVQTVRNGAEYVAKKLKDLGLVPGNVVQHNHWSGKNCPQQIRAAVAGIDWAAFMALVSAAFHGPSIAPPPAPVVIAPPPAVVARPVFAALLVDGAWGAQTTRALQWQLRTDGHYGGLIDGDFGPMTKRALQSWLKGLGVYGGNVDGDFGPMTRRALQTLLRTSSFYTGLIDGDFGRLSTRALQTFLNSRIHTWKG